MSSSRKEDLRPRLAQLLNKAQKNAHINIRVESEITSNDTQSQLRQFLEKSREEGRLDRAKLLQFTEGLSPQAPPQSLQRISLASNRGIKIPNEIQQKANAPSSPDSIKKNQKTKNTTLSKGRPSQTERLPLRDSIYFNNEIDYENYLNTELENQGLFRDLFEKLKLLYVSRKDLQALMLLFEHLPEMDLTECQINLEKAEVFRQLDDMEKAYLYLDKAVRADSTSVLAIRSLAIFHKLKEEYELALHWLLEWKKLSVQDAEVHYQLGVVYHRLGQDPLAMLSVRKSLNIDPKHMLSRSLLERLL